MQLAQYFARLSDRNRGLTLFLSEISRSVRCTWARSWRKVWNEAKNRVTGDVPEAKLKALEKALANNALTAGDFKPGEGFTFFHSVGDEVVPYCNYESVRNTWGSNHIKGVTYKSNTTLHVATGAAFFTTYCGSLAGEIFNDKWQACEQTKGNRLW